MSQFSIVSRVIPLAALMLSSSACIIETDPDDWWYYCDRYGCYRCDDFSCELAPDSADGACWYDQCDSGSCTRRCDAGTTPTRCEVLADCEAAFICSDGACRPRSAPCQEHSDCGAGGYCSNGACKPSGQCARDSDCSEVGEKMICDDRGSCVPDPHGSAISCSSSTDCEEGLCLAGICATCAGDCGGGKTCELARHCGEGRACLDGQCVNHCSKDADCGSAQRCSSGVCVPKTTSCVGPEGCADGEVCLNQRCYPECTSSGSCLNDSDSCTDELTAEGRAVRLCVPEPWSALECSINGDCGDGRACVNGLCRKPCSSAADCGLCEEGSFVCAVGGFCMTSDEANAVCTLATDCAGGAHCINGQCQTL